MMGLESSSYGSLTMTSKDAAAAKFIDANDSSKDVDKYWCSIYCHQTGTIASKFGTSNDNSSDADVVDGRRHSERCGQINYF